MDARIRRVRPRLSQTGAKVYNFLCLVYLEDLEAYGATYGDLLAYLDSLHVKCAVSPVHDRDFFTADDVWSWCERHVDPETGDLDMKYVDRAPYVGKHKKPHVHLLFKMTRQQSAQEMTELMSGLLEIRPSIWEKCMDPVGSLRYFAHLDSPDKASYSAYDIHGFGGIKLDALVLDDSKSKMHALTDEVAELIDKNGVRYFYQLVRLARDTGDAELLACVFGKHTLFNAIIRSKTEERRDDWNRKRAEDEERMRRAKFGELLG